MIYFFLKEAIFVQAFLVLKACLKWGGLIFNLNDLCIFSPLLFCFFFQFFFPLKDVLCPPHSILRPHMHLLSFTSFFFYPHFFFLTFVCVSALFHSALLFFVSPSQNSSPPSRGTHKARISMISKAIFKRKGELKKKPPHTPFFPF